MDCVYLCVYRIATCLVWHQKAVQMICIAAPVCEYMKIPLFCRNTYIIIIINEFHRDTSLIVINIIRVKYFYGPPCRLVSQNGSSSLIICIRFVFLYLYVSVPCVLCVQVIIIIITWRQVSGVLSSITTCSGWPLCNVKKCLAELAVRWHIVMFTVMLDACLCGLRTCSLQPSRCTDWRLWNQLNKTWLSILGSLSLCSTIK